MKKSDSDQHFLATASILRQPPSTFNVNNEHTESNTPPRRIRLPLIIIVFFSLVLPLSHPSQAAPVTQDENNQAQLRYQIQVLQQDLANKETSRSEAADVLKESESAISNIKRKLAKLAQKEDEIRNNLHQLKIRSKQVNLNISDTREHVGRLLYQQYVNGTQVQVKLLFNQQNVNQISQKLYYLQVISQERSKHIADLNAQLEELEILTDITLEKQQEIVVIQIEQSRQKEQLEQEKDQRNHLLAEIIDQIKAQQHQISKLKRDEERLATLANQINKLVTSKKTSPSLFNKKLPDASHQGQPFKSLKGQLNLPVLGELINRFGSHRSGKYIIWKGLFIRSPSGNEIKAIAAGQVVFSDWLRGFGNLIIIDHGDSYLSLYGYNETIYQQVGEIVRGGDTIATVGNSGGNLDYGLYFELRHKSTPFDPLTWIKVE